MLFINGPTRLEYMEDAFDAYRSIVFFDTETTGFSDEDQIIELAAVRYEDGIEVERMDNYIRLWSHPTLPERIVELTGITDEILAEQGVSGEEALERFMNISRGGALLMAYNAPFDIRFMRYLTEHCNSCSVRNDAADMLEAYRSYAPAPHKLANAIERFDLGGIVRNSHRAIDDVYALAAVTDELAKRGVDVVDFRI